jgi:cytochrome c-type biogenesis protein CcmH
VSRILPLLTALFWLVAVPALAITSPDEMLRDPALEARARALGKELRCLVCQNQSIDDSNAELARDLRRLVRERLVAGDSDAEIRAFLVERYGDFVLLKPPVGPGTWLLWFGPPALLLVGAGLIAVFFRARGRIEPAAAAELDPAERARLERLLADNGGTGQP